MYADILI